MHGQLQLVARGRNQLLEIKELVLVRGDLTNEDLSHDINDEKNKSFFWLQ